jgi:hypothetical protein
MTQFIKGDVQKWIGQYVKVRDLKRGLEAKHKEELKTYTDILNQLEGRLQNFFSETGQDSAPTGAGTAYLSTTYRASIADKEAFKKFVLDFAEWQMLDWKANAKAVRSFVKDKKAPVPGVNLTGITKVRINRPGETADEDQE